MSSTDRSESRTGSRIFTVGGLIVLALLVGGWFFLNQQCKLSQRPFNEASWKAAYGDRESTERLAMIESLRNPDDSARVVGKSREAIDQQLGQAEPQNYFKDFDLMYRLGPSDWILRSQRFLALRFDDDGNCVEAKVLSD